MRYWLTVRYGARDSRTYTINAKNDDEFRKIAIAKYGREIIDSHNHLWGTTIQKEGVTHEVMGKTYHTFIGDLHYSSKRWYWDFGKVIIKFDKSEDYRAIGTVRMQGGKPYWLAKRYDVFNGRVAVPIKKGKKKSKPAPFGL